MKTIKDIRMKEDLKAIAWAITLKGYLGLHWKKKKKKDTLLSLYICPVIGMSNISKNLANKFHNMTKAGHVYPQRRNRIIWMWEVNKQSEVKELLEDIVEYIPDELTKEKASIVIKFCEMRKLGKEKGPYSWYVRKLVRKLADLENKTQEEVNISE